MGVRGYLGRMVTVDEWNIGVADLQLEDLVSRERLAATNAVRPPVRWVHKPWFVRFQADPCLMEHEGHLFLYHEDVLFGSNKGRLRCAELAADGTLARRSSPMMRLSHHAAYPYVFKHLGSFYCVPETCTSKRVALYKADAPLGPWRRHSVLLEGVSACDSTIFHFDGRWWLFCTVADADRRTWMTNLHIWHAPDPWGPWEPHRLQPAKTDIHSARAAGRPFVVNGVLYRPAQDCSPRYGARTVINRILTLTPRDFEEEVCSYVEPDPLGPYSEGLHTVTSAGGVVVVDGCRKRPTLNLFKIGMAIVAEVRGRFERFAAVT